MGLRQLAGPFDVKSSAGVTISGAAAHFWYPDCGFILEYGPFGRVMGRMALDGVYEDFAMIFNVFPRYFGWDQIHKRALLSSWSPSGAGENEWELEPILLLPTYVGVKHGAGSSTQFYFKLADRRLFWGDGSGGTGGHVFGFDEDGNSTAEIQLPWMFGYMRHGRNDNEVFLAESTGAAVTRCVFYNVVEKALSSDIMYIPMNCSGVFYIPEHGVILTYHSGSPDTINIWSLEVRPTTISDPELIKGTTAQGRVATYRVRVTGDHADPCPKELVNWELSGLGRLLSTQSKTDDDGYAEVKVRYPLHETGDVTLTANVQC